MADFLLDRAEWARRAFGEPLYPSVAVGAIDGLGHTALPSLPDLTQPFATRVCPVAVMVPETQQWL